MLEDQKNIETLTFGSKKKDLRTRKLLTLRAVAKKIKLHYGYLSQIENNKEIPSEKTILLLAKTLDHDNTDELFALARKVPSDIIKILFENGDKPFKLLRKNFVKPKNNNTSPPNKK